MLKAIAKFGHILSKTEMKSILAGQVQVICDFSDGTGWDLNFKTGAEQNAFLAAENCTLSGGSLTVNHH